MIIEKEQRKQQVAIEMVYDRASGRPSTSVSGSPSMDAKIDWLVKTVKEIKDESICKKEIKTMIKDIIQHEIKSVKEELEEG